MTYKICSFVTGHWSGPGASSKDWIGLYPVGAVAGSTSSLWWMYIHAGTTSITFSSNMTTDKAAWTMPSGSTVYEFRYFCCDSYTTLATSNSFSAVVSSTVSPTLRPLPASFTPSSKPTTIPSSPSSKPKLSSASFAPTFSPVKCMIF